MDCLAFLLSNQQCPLDVIGTSSHTDHFGKLHPFLFFNHDFCCHFVHAFRDGVDAFWSNAIPEIVDEGNGVISPVAEDRGMPAVLNTSPGIYDSGLQIVDEGSEKEPQKVAESFENRPSTYRGVTRHKRTGRYEAHLWDSTYCEKARPGGGSKATSISSQVTVLAGGYDEEENAVRAYDLAAIKYWGPTTITNFPVANYEKEILEMENMTRQELVASLRRKSTGFSRGAAIDRGVTRHRHRGRWQARIWRTAGKKDLYLGNFDTQEEAAQAYDIAAIKLRGINAVTNFDMSHYDITSIVAGDSPGDATGENALNAATAEMSLDQEYWPQDVDIDFLLPSSSKRYENFNEQAMIGAPGYDESWVAPLGC